MALKLRSVLATLPPVRQRFKLSEARTMSLVPPEAGSDVNAALRLIVQRALLLTRGNGAAIALAHKGPMTCQASLGTIAPPVGCQLDVSSGFSGECVRTGRVLCCDDSENDPRVDAASCRRLGIRSILAAPIRFERRIVGLLEVFSAQPYAFHDGDLAAVEHLAETVPLSPLGFKPTPPPRLLLELEPGHRIFLRNLTDSLRPQRTAPLRLTSRPARFWPDVFVPSRLPWERFLQSLLLHAVMLAALGIFSQSWLSQRHFEQRLTFNKSDVIYYFPSDYPPPLARGKTSLQTPRKGQLALAKRRVMVVPHEPDKRAQTTAAPEIKLKHDLRLLHILAWNPITPAVPLSATALRQLGPPQQVAVVAPPPELTPALAPTATRVFPTAVIAPPPDVAGISRPPALTAPPSAVIGPPPSLPQSTRSVGDINIGHLEVVAPAPRMPVNGQGASLTAVRMMLGSAGNSEVVAPAPQMLMNGEGASLTAVRMMLGSAGNSVVPPPPSVEGHGNLGSQTTGFSRAQAMQVALPATVVQSASATTRIPSSIAPGTPSMDRQAPRETLHDTRETLADSKELSVNFVGLALALPGSSYFPSHEVFIAEERLSPHQSRLIKLVYEFLPYQPRLSEFAPNYPAVDKLRATRDPSCDETLMQATSSVSAPGWSPGHRLQLSSRLQDQGRATLTCYRTTADDYRRARIRRHLR